MIRSGPRQHSSAALLFCWLSTSNDHARRRAAPDNRLVDQSPPRRPSSARRDRPTKLATPSTASQTGSTHLGNRPPAPKSPSRLTPNLATPPAVSSLGGLRTPAPVCAAPPSWGRHPQTFTIAVISISPDRRDGPQNETARAVERCARDAAAGPNASAELAMDPKSNCSSVRSNAATRTISVVSNRDFEMR
jgi:hypothetical protein